MDGLVGKHLSMLLKRLRFSWVYGKEIRMNDIKQTTCKRCGRKLKNDEAIKRGMGIICWRKWQNENNHKKLWEDKDE